MDLTTLRHRYRIYTGPTLVHAIANRLSQAYVQVTLEGTAHVYVETNLTVERLLGILGTTWTHRDIQRLGAA
jgi:hypothetical protein